LIISSANDVIHTLWRRLFRLTADSRKEFSESLHLLNSLLNESFSDDEIKRGGERALTEVDPTLPEAYFEKAFIECYGRESLNKVQREFPVIDINGQTRWVDYYIQKIGNCVAIEKNGEVYHHPIITGKKVH